MSRLVRSALAVLSILAHVAIVPAAKGQTHYSARIYSLGGDVAGIVPDFYTDLQLNPAYASLSDAFTINYGARRSPVYSFPFYRLGNDLTLTEQGINQYYTNELLAHGFRIGGWRFAVISEWYLDARDQLESNLDRYFSNLSYSTTTRTTLDDEARNYVHAAVSCSRFIGGDHIIGIRLGAFDSYSSDKRQTTWYTRSHEYGENIEDMYLARTTKRHDYDDTGYRWLSPYIQLGLLLNAQSETPSEVTLQVSRSEVDARWEDFRLEITNYYDDQTGEQERHYYTRQEWLDQKGGDLWAFNLSGRHFFPGRVRIYASGEYRRASYDGDWIDAQRNYEWRSYVSDLNSYSAESGDGDYSEYIFFCKAGRTFNLERRIDVTAACNSSFRRTLNEDGGMMELSRRTLKDDALNTTSLTGPVHLRVEKMSVHLAVPVAIEFRPRPYFTLFTSFGLNTSWGRTTEECGIPVEYFNGAATASIARGGGRSAALGATVDASRTENRRETASTGYWATLGCSLNFRDRLVADLYLGSDITPDYLTGLILDLRYRF